MTGKSDVLAPLDTDKVFLLEAEFSEYRREDLVNSNTDRLLAAEKFRNAVLRQLLCNSLTVEKTEGAEPLYRSLYLTDIGAEIFSEE